MYLKGEVLSCGVCAIELPLVLLAVYMEKNSFVPAGNDGIIISRSEGVLEQAKKRDHKVYITDVAIDKVSIVNVPELSRSINETIQNEHKNILREGGIYYGKSN